MAGQTQFSPETGLISQGDFLLKILAADLPIVTNNKKISFYNVPCAFDIEVSSFYNNGEKNASMYIWQFGILNWVTYGRTWEEYQNFLAILSEVLGLSEDMRLVVYVHNLAYEWQFVRKILKWDKVFFLDERKPVYAITGGYEFRCSLKLSSKSLAKVGEDLVKYKEHKHVGDLDYQLNRFHSTPLTEEELGYCEADIRVLLAYIQEKIETDRQIDYIPLTNTGYVRNHCRRACFKKYKDYKRLMSTLTLDAEEYKQLKRGFAGGFTHASARYVAEGKEKPLENVGSFDFTSSYPAVMLTEQFPMSKSVLISHIDDWNQFYYYLNNYCCLFDVTLTNVFPKVDYDHPVSRSKLILPEDKAKKKEILDGITEDNGRIVTAKVMSITMTEQDWFVFESFYNYEHIEVRMFRIYEKRFLPKPFYRAILELYKKKTILKDVDGEEINYMISKNMLNAAYGMIVTDIVREVIEYDYENSEYTEPTKPDLEEAIEKYNKAGKRFLFYPWGVWVTAYARRNLFSGILACGDDYIYSDTDSIKIFNPDKHMDYINDYNNKLLNRIEKIADFLGIDSTEYAPKNKKGSSKPIGVWEYEGTYKRFKTLGAKRYLYEKENGTYVLTVAGVNKKKACDYLQNKARKHNFPAIAIYHSGMLLWYLLFFKIESAFDYFTHDLIVPEEYSGRLTLTYIDKPCDGIAKDYLGNTCEFHEKSFIHMEPSEYNLTMSSEYRGFINLIYGIKEDSW